MAASIIGPKFYAWDRNGKPLAFGKLYTYQARTNVPKPTYQSEDKVVENTNPVILNGEGYANVYLYGSYKMVLKDVDNNEIWSADPVTSAQPSEWVNCLSATYKTPTSFSVDGNFTAEYEEGRKVRLDYNTVNYVYATITTSIYAAGETLISIDESVVTVGLQKVCASITGPNSSISENDIAKVSPFVFKSTDDMVAGIPIGKENAITHELRRQYSTAAVVWRTNGDGEGLLLNGGIYAAPITKLNVVDFGAVPGEDCTEAFNAAKEYAASLGGAIITVPYDFGKGWYLNNFDLDVRSVIFEGTTSGYSYGSNEDSDKSVQIRPVVGSTYATRLKGTNGPFWYGAAFYSGFKNLQIIDKSGSGLVDYGLFIDCEATILEEVCIRGFNYNCVIGDAANSNRFKNCSFLGAKYNGFSITEGNAASYLHPGIAGMPSPPSSNTSFTMEGCVFRENDFGIIIRDGVNFNFDNCTSESNKQAGLFIYRLDTSSIRLGKFTQCWFENNYDGFTGDTSGYTIAGNRMLTVGNASNPIPDWTHAEFAGYQIQISSQTKTGTGGCDTITFDGPTIAGGPGAVQKGVLGLSGYNTKFIRPWLTNGDVANFIRFAPNAKGTKFIEPIQDNDPGALVPSLVAPIYGQLGTDGAYIRPDHYLESEQSVVIRASSSTAFTIDTQETFITKIGRQVHIEVNATITGNLFVNTPENLWIIGLPYFTSKVGALAGSCWVRPTGGGASVLNDGESQMYFLTTNSLYAIKHVFNTVNIGHTFDIRVNATYTIDQ